MLTAFLFGLLCLQNLVRISGAQVNPLSAQVEFDVVFPRNDTYAPMPVMPIVFALQNPQPSLLVGITWRLFPYAANRDYDTSLFGQFIDLKTTDFSNKPYFGVNSSQPYFLVEWATVLNTAGSYTLVWSLMTENCSSTQGVTMVQGQTWQNGSTRIDFKIQNGAQLPSLVSSPNVCPSKSQIFNITGMLSCDRTQCDTRNTCAILGDTPAPTPCAVQIDSALATSMSSSVTASVCSAAVNTTWIHCPTATSKTSLAAAWNRDGREWTGFVLRSWLGLCLVFAASMVV